MTKQPVRVAVLIPLRDREHSSEWNLTLERLGRTVDSVRSAVGNANFPVEITVGTGSVKEVIHKFGSSLRVLQCDVPLKLGASNSGPHGPWGDNKIRKQGLMVADANLRGFTHVVFLDADDWVRNDFFSQLGVAIERWGVGTSFIVTSGLIVVEGGPIYITRALPYVCGSGFVGSLLSRETTKIQNLVEHVQSQFWRSRTFAGRFVARNEIRKLPAPLIAYQKSSRGTISGDRKNLKADETVRTIRLAALFKRAKKYIRVRAHMKIFRQGQNCLRAYYDGGALSSDST